MNLDTLIVITGTGTQGSLVGVPFQSVILGNPNNPNHKDFLEPMPVDGCIEGLVYDKDGFGPCRGNARAYKACGEGCKCSSDFKVADVGNCARYAVGGMPRCVVSCGNC